MNRKILLTLVTLLLLAGSHNANLSAQNKSKSTKTENVDAIIKCIKDPTTKNVLVASHRADWRNFPENSLEGMESAINMGVDILEIDLAMTSDSILVLMHDRNVDRTTTGKGSVNTYTLDSIKGLFLKNGCGVKTDYKIPTLEAALLLCKNRVVINIDKGYQYYDDVDKLLKKTGMTKQILIKGSKPAAQVLSDFSKHSGEKMMYMPIIDFHKPDAYKLFEGYLNIMPAMAYEVVWEKWTPEVEKCMKTILKNKAKVWANSMWGDLCGGDLYDDLALKDPEKIYGKYLLLGVTMIQTDRPETLIKYLRSKGLHR